MGKWGDNISIEAKKATNNPEFKLEVLFKDQLVESHDNLTIENVEKTVNSSSSYIKVETVRGANPPIKSTPISLKGGSNGDDGSISMASSGIINDDSESPGESLKFTALDAGEWSNNHLYIEAKAATNKTDGFQLVVELNGNELESFDDLTMENIEKTVNSSSSYIKVESVKGANNPKKVTISFQGGVDANTGLIAPDFVGDASLGNGLHAFDVVDDINIVAMPDMAGNRDAIIGGYVYCKERGDCFFVADSPANLIPTQVKNFKEAQEHYTGGNPFNSSFAALYYPWVYMSDPLNQGKPKPVPPSGAVAGTYAYTDSVRGVHKAPAGISEGYLDSVIGIERIITQSEQDGLNPIGINVIRSFPTAGICIWGARTLSNDSEWRYINIRRLFLFLEESLYNATQWVVFEPNSPALWGSIIRNITAFLLRVWRDGALYGATPEEAFFVKVDEENNPEEVRDAGQLIIEIGVAPVRPAEFVIIRIKQKTQAK
jgi:hypothetical protein